LARNATERSFCGVIGKAHSSHGTAKSARLAFHAIAIRFQKREALVRQSDRQIGFLTANGSLRQRVRKCRNTLFATFFTDCVPAAPALVSPRPSSSRPPSGSGLPLPSSVWSTLYCSDRCGTSIPRGWSGFIEPSQIELLVIKNSGRYGELLSGCCHLLGGISDDRTSRQCRFQFQK
jgi:hypothetical protein